MSNSIQQSARWLATGPPQKFELLRPSKVTRRVNTDSQNPEVAGDPQKSFCHNVYGEESTWQMSQQQLKTQTDATDSSLLQSRLEEVQRQMDNGEQQVRGVWQLWEGDNANVNTAYYQTCGVLTRESDPNAQGPLAVPIVQESRLFNFNQLAATLDDMQVEALL